jgi:DNA polymerase III subunit epsilon
MKLELIKPLAIFDLEATGLTIGKDRIVEIAILKVNPDGSKETYEKKINPEIPIPIEVSDIHGIYDVDVLSEPKLQDISNEIVSFLDNCDLAGYNCNKFDVPLLIEELDRVGVDFKIDDRKIIDVQNIFHKMEQRTLSAAMKFYCDKELENAHRAMADVEATFEILEAQLEKYPELEKNPSFLSEFATFGSKTLDFARRIGIDEKDNAVFNFGKYKGTLVLEIFKKDKGYYNWIMNGDFAKDTKNHFTKLYQQVNK